MRTSSILDCLLTNCMASKRKEKSKNNTDTSHCVTAGCWLAAESTWHCAASLSSAAAVQWHSSFAIYTHRNMRPSAKYWGTFAMLSPNHIIRDMPPCPHPAFGAYDSPLNVCAGARQAGRNDHSNSPRAACFAGRLKTQIMRFCFTVKPLHHIHRRLSSGTHRPIMAALSDKTVGL